MSDENVVKKVKRVFSKEDKIKIIEESKEIGIPKVLEKYNLIESMFYRWRRQMQSSVPEVVISHNTNDKESSRLQDENNRLKIIVVDQMLEIERLKEVIKKKANS